MRSANLRGTKLPSPIITFIFLFIDQLEQMHIPQHIPN